MNLSGHPDLDKKIKYLRRFQSGDLNARRKISATKVGYEAGLPGGLFSNKKSQFG
jgi:hypothetical protein